MREWVIPFLLELKQQNTAPDKWEKVKSEKEEHYKKERKVYYDLAKCVHFIFTDDLCDKITILFGSVLAEIPKEDFVKIFKNGNVFSIHSGCPGSMLFRFTLGNCLSKGDKIIIINIPYDMSKCSELEIKGAFAHEIAHVFSFEEKDERLIDKIAIGWGFGEEIKAKNKYINSLYTEEAENEC